MFKQVPKFLLFKWCHFARSCSCCGLAGHLAPACPLQKIFMTNDIVMQKPMPLVLDIAPTSFAFKVDHLRHMFAFLPNHKFREVVLKYLPDFVFEKHGPDIERALAILTSVDERVLMIDILWDECKGCALSHPQIEPDEDKQCSVPNSHYDFDDFNFALNPQEAYKHFDEF
eukprot:TRINITY_DN4712_c0_g1_i10.p1 TRINITY_DN4712_c0_g1~~TRINITY_DN4712_c0_g1_i10.p1  ORF type:complete len:171 (+),score=8.64 TRINITY_DN4712_c0_g1_i10:731-1243(+)